MGFRAFIAVDVECGPVLRDAIEELAHLGRALKPVSPGNVHVTLKFLGETEEQTVPDLGGVMRKAVQGLAPFEVRLIGTGVFPNARSPRVVWVGMEGAEPLKRIVTGLEDGCVPLGFSRDRYAFSPHLTLARVREGFKADLVDFLKYGQVKDFGSFAVNAIKLKKSVLTPNGPIYSDVLEIGL